MQAKRITSAGMACCIVTLAAFLVARVAEAKKGGSMPKHLRKGFQLFVRHPHTGKKEAGKIKKIVFDKELGIHVATVQFGKGWRGRILKSYALDALEKPEDQHEHHFQQQQETVNSKLQWHYGLDGSKVTVHDLPGIAWPTRSELKRFRKGKLQSPYLQAALDSSLSDGRNKKERKQIEKAFYDRLKKTGSFGFEHGGASFLTKHIGSFSEKVRLHETIHALSDNFLRRAYDALPPVSANTLVEGITDYFTKKISAGGKNDKRTVYHRETEIASLLARLVGEQRLRDIFFGGEHDVVHRLLDAIRQRSSEATLSRFTRALGKGKLEQAVKHLKAALKGIGTTHSQPSAWSIAQTPSPPGPTWGGAEWRQEPHGPAMVVKAR